MRKQMWKLGGAVALGGLLLGAAGCNLEKELDVVLPAYADELVVECYLEAGTVPRLTVLESGPYLPDVPDRPTVISWPATRT